MKKAISYILVAVLILSMLLVPATRVSAISASLTFDQSSYTVYRDHTFNVTVVLNSSVKLGSLQFNVTWDPEYLEFVSYSNGSVASNAMTVINDENVANGYLKAGLISFSGLSSGDVLVITFRAKEKGTTNLTINIEDASDTTSNPVDVVSGTSTINIKVNHPPVASFTVPDEVWVGQSVTFNASASYDPDGSVVLYKWDFGDGNVVTTTNPVITHVFNEGGKKNVSLTVFDNMNATSTSAKIVKILSFNIQVQSEKIYVNRTAEIPVIINTTETLGSLQFNVTFDPEYLRVINFTSEVGLAQFNIMGNTIQVAVATTNGIRSGEIGKLVVMGIHNGSTELDGVIIDATTLSADKRYGKFIPGVVQVYNRLRGDINFDNRITAADALLYLRYAVGLSIDPYTIDPTYDDLNNDGKITAADALIALRIAVGLESPKY